LWFDSVFISAPTTQIHTLSLHDALPIYPQGRYRVGPSIVADAVIVAVPAPAAARVLERGRADVAAVLRGVNHASVVTVTLAYPKDRKSTRLNSSHQIISYAVFCLKKKNT